MGEGHRIQTGFRGGRQRQTYDGGEALACSLADVPAACPGGDERSSRCIAVEDSISGRVDARPARHSTLPWRYTRAGQIPRVVPAHRTWYTLPSAPSWRPVQRRFTHKSCGRCVDTDLSNHRPQTNTGMCPTRSAASLTTNQCGSERAHTAGGSRPMVR